LIANHSLKKENKRNAFQKGCRWNLMQKQKENYVY
jgi:hypothetical protein